MTNILHLSIRPVTRAGGHPPAPLDASDPDDAPGRATRRKMATSWQFLVRIHPHLGPAAVVAAIFTAEDSEFERLRDIDPNPRHRDEIGEKARARAARVWGQLKREMQDRIAHANVVFWQRTELLEAWTAQVRSLGAAERARRRAVEARHMQNIGAMLAETARAHE